MIIKLTGKYIYIPKQNLEQHHRPAILAVGEGYAEELLREKYQELVGNATVWMSYGEDLGEDDRLFYDWFMDEQDIYVRAGKTSASESQKFKRIKVLKQLGGDWKNLMEEYFGIK